MGVIAVLAAGCHFGPISSSSSGNPAIVIIYQREDIDPGAKPSNYATLTQAGLDISTTVHYRVRGREIEIDLVHEDSIIERERYLDQPDRFALVQAAEETFEPPLDLLRFPFVPKHPWHWEGQMRSGTATLDASGSISADLRSTFIGDAQRDVIHVEVKLTMKSKSGTALPERRMSFDFRPKAGLQAREFGEASTRVPRNAP